MKRSLLIYFLGMITVPAIAQDTHYWGQQFGTRSALLGGAVVAGSRDNTMIYYNAAALGFIDTSSISINATAYSIENIKVRNAVGQSADLKSAQIGVIPLVVAGTINKQTKRLKVGYAFISPVVFSFKATARLDQPLQIVNDTESPGLEEFIGQKSLSSSVREDAVCLGLGYKLSDEFSIGMSHVFTYRTQSYTNASLSRVFLNDGRNTLVTSSTLESFNYYHLRYAPRIAFAYRRGKYDAGLTITAPTMGLYGRGTVAADITATNIKLNGVRQDALANDRQTRLKTHYHTPLSIAGGVNMHMDKSVFSVTMQYYARKNVYDILRANPAVFVRPANALDALGSQNFLRVKTAARPIMNVAIAYEHVVDENLKVDMSVRSDKSYFDKALVNQVGIKPDISSWNITHFTFGGTYRRGRNMVSIGLLLGLGADRNKLQEDNLGQINEENFLQGYTSITTAHYSTIGLLLGYSFNLKTQ